MRRGARDAQLDELLVLLRLQGGMPYRSYSVREVVPYPVQRTVDDLCGHVQPARHDHESVHAAGSLERQVAGGKQRPERMTDDHNTLSLRLEVADGPVQDLDADVDLGLEVRQRQLRVAGCQVVLQGEGLVNMGELERLVIGEIHELVLRIAGEFMERATLFVDPHRVGIGVAGYSEQLGDIGRYRCRLVFGGRGGCPGGKELVTTGDQRRGPQEHGKIDELPLAGREGKHWGAASVPWYTGSDRPIASAAGAAAAWDVLEVRSRGDGPGDPVPGMQAEALQGLQRMDPALPAAARATGERSPSTLTPSRTQTGINS